MLLPGEMPPAVEPHGRPIASVRLVLFSVPAVEGLVLTVPDADGLDGVVVDVPAEPLIAPEPLIPAEPLLVADDAPALPAELPDAPPEPPDDPPEPPPLCASARPALPARRTAAINDTE